MIENRYLGNRLPLNMVSFEISFIKIIIQKYYYQRKFKT